jgi:signal transduction histidine kinase
MNQRFIRNIILPLVIIIICLLFTATAKAYSAEAYNRKYLKFHILETEFNEGKYIDGDMSELGFIEYNNYETPFTRPKDDRMLTFRSVFSIDSTYSNQDIYLVVLPIDYACRLYLNGELIHVRGDIKRKYTNRLHYSENILLSSNHIKYNGINEIAIQLYPKEGETYPLGEVFITNSYDASNYVFYRNLLGTKLLAALSLSGFVFFIFYLITYISRREYKKQQFLYFAFMNLFFVVSYSNNIFTNNYANIYLVEKIARLGFPLFIFVGLCFLLEYTSLFKRKGLIKIGLIIMYIPALIIVLTPKTTTDVIKAYNSYPLISLFAGNFMLFILVLLFYLRERNAKSLFLLLIFSVNILAGLYDGYYFAVLKVKPFMLLTPITVFGINIIIFFILAVDHSKLYHLALDSSKKLEVLNQELEITVDKRTKKIKEYTKMLEEANSTKDKFFSIIAHDLKNPFNTLIGYSDVLKSDFREYGQDEIYQHLNTIYNTSVNGYNLLENLLKWSQSQTNKIQFEPKKVNLCDIVNACIQDSENQSNFKDIELINEVSKSYYIIADKNLLKTVIRNLINNAIKFTERNGMIVISSTKKDSIIEFSIKDTGIGMKEEEIENLFKIDKIYSKPGTDREKGSGLGLILCKEFIEIHGGKIWAESTLGSGSEFKFTIPKMININ